MERLVPQSGSFDPEILKRLGGTAVDPSNFQALCVAGGLFIVMPRLLSREAWKLLKPHWVFAAGLAVAFAVFTYFCIFRIPTALSELLQQ